MYVNYVYLCGVYYQQTYAATDFDKWLRLDHDLKL